jgi:hypothetical protein
MPSPVPFRSLQVLFLLATQWPVKSPSQVAGGSPVEALQLHSNFIPMHSLTGPVGQPFASRLGGQQFVSCDAPTPTTEPGSPVCDVSLQVFDSLIKCELANSVFLYNYFYHLRMTTKGHNNSLHLLLSYLRSWRVQSKLLFPEPAV